MELELSGDLGPLWHNGVLSVPLTFLLIGYYLVCTAVSGSMRSKGTLLAIEL